MTTRIVGTGSSLPENIITNDELAKIMDTSDEWISSRTGIKERRIAKEETTATMAAAAAKSALKDAKITAEEIDLIIVGTITPDYVTPSTACEVQNLIGAGNALAFDVNAACSGFIFALHTAYAYLGMGIYKTALCIGAETLSKIIDWEDRSTCVLFGDGAGAAVLKANEKGILSFVQGSDGAKGKALLCADRKTCNPFTDREQTIDYVTMDGKEVYKFAVTYVPSGIVEAVEKANLKLEDIDCFILHQANVRIIESVAKRLKVSVDKFPMTLNKYGNMSAASVPVLLDEVNKSGKLKKGDKVVLAGFGGGLTWGITVLEW